MTLPVSGAISLNAVNVELGLSGTTTISLNQSSLRTLFGVGSGAISMSNGHGKANQFAFSITSNQSNANLRTLAVNAGWNGSTKAVATINGGVVISASTTGNTGLTIDGSWPNGIELINSGTILGMGGNGGTGGGTSSAGAAGAVGGKALHVAVAVSINNGGTIAGGGGGGGGGGTGKNVQSGGFAGGGGGGGGRTGSTNSSGGYRGSAYAVGASGGSGTVSAAGGGGGGGYAYHAYGSGSGGAGGTGGGWGANGNAGGGASQSGGGGAGGAGSCLTGNSYITWLATGTRLGSIG